MSPAFCARSGACRSTSVRRSSCVSSRDGRYAEIADTIGVSVSRRRDADLPRPEVAAPQGVVAPFPCSGAAARPLLSRSLFEGGVIAERGAAAGTGLLVKAAVAIVAARFGTGVGGDRAVAPLLRQPRHRALVSHRRAQGAEDGLTAQRCGTAAFGLVTARRARARPRARATGAQATCCSRSGPGSAAAPPRPPGLGNQSGRVSQVTAPVSGLTSTVQQVVEAPTAALPVQHSEPAYRLRSTSRQSPSSASRRPRCPCLKPFCSDGGRKIPSERVSTRS